MTNEIVEIGHNVQRCKSRWSYFCLTPEPSGIQLLPGYPMGGGTSGLSRSFYGERTFSKLDRMIPFRTDNA
jgi:hypothetical protein